MSVRKRTWTTRLGEHKEAWIVDYADQDGSRHIKTFDRKKDADAYEATVRIDVRAGVHTSGKTTVAQAGAKWIADAEDRLEPATVESYRQHLKAHIEPYIGTLKLSELTVPLVVNFRDRLKKDERSAAMIKRVIGDLGSILADAQERGLVAQNVVRSLSKRRKGKSGEQREKRDLKVGVDIPSIEEIRVLIPHLKGRWRPLLLTAIFTGLRASELRGLQWGDVDLKKNIVSVSQRADRFNRIGNPKSKAGQRDVPLPPMVANELRAWKLKGQKSELGLVFPTNTGGIDNHSNIVQRGLAPAQIAAGITKKQKKGPKGETVIAAKYPGLHALRHFYASWCINRVEDGGLGLPIKIVQVRLGHASMAMTTDTYGHLFPSGDDGKELEQAEKNLFAVG